MSGREDQEAEVRRRFDIRVFTSVGYWWYDVEGYNLSPWPCFTARGARRAAKRWCRRQVRSEMKARQRARQNNFTYVVGIKEGWR